MTLVRTPLTALALCATVLLPGALASCTNQTAETVNVGVSSIIFVKRAHTTVDGSGNVSIDVSGGNTQVIDYERYVPGERATGCSGYRPERTARSR